MENTTDRTAFYNDGDAALPTMTMDDMREIQRADREAQQQPYLIAAGAILAALLIALIFVKWVARRR